jgi:hypothetical protein
VQFLQVTAFWFRLAANILLDFFLYAHMFRSLEPRTGLYDVHTLTFGGYLSVASPIETTPSIGNVAPVNYFLGGRGFINLALRNHHGPLFIYSYWGPR